MHREAAVCHFDGFYCCTGEDAAWTYNPGIKPFREGHIDPSYIVQMLFQLHAKSVRWGYLVSYARSGTAFFCVQASPTFIAKAAAFLKAVTETLLTPAVLPLIPHDAAGFEGEMRSTWIEMHECLIEVMRTVVVVPPAAGAALP